MFAEKTPGLITQVIDAELENAKKRFGDRYHNMHEAWAVLHEEVGEVKRDYKALKNQEKWLWISITRNRAADIRLIMELAEQAKHLAMEACQVAAVCKKMLEGAK